MSSMRLTVLSVALLAACGDHTPASAPPSVVVSMTPAGSVSPAATAPASVSLDALQEPWLAYVGDGNLLVIDKEQAFLHDGARWLHHAEKPGSPIDPNLGGNGLEALVTGTSGGYARRYDILKMLSTRDLHVLFEGPARRVDGALVLPSPTAAGASANDPYDDDAVLIEQAAGTVTLQLPQNAGSGKQVDTIEYDAKSDLTLVSWSRNDQHFATAYRTRSGAVLGNAVPHDYGFPTVAQAGTVQYYIAKLPPRMRPSASSGSSMSSSMSMPIPAPIAAGGVRPEPVFGYDNDAPRRALVARDMASGQVLKQREIACKDFLGNPTVSPSGDTVLVTCSGNALVLDGRTLAEKRRIPNIIPGCDNGYDLTGTIVSDGPAVLQLEGCGGIAKIDLGAGKWLCGDNEGVRGAPYEPMAGPSVRRMLPKVPRCSKSEEGSRQLLDADGRYEWLYDENAVLGEGGTRIQLEPEAGTPVLTRKRDRLAYVLGHKVVMRALPSGAIVSP